MHLKITFLPAGRFESGLYQGGLPHQVKHLANKPFQVNYLQGIQYQNVFAVAKHQYFYPARIALIFEMIKQVYRINFLPKR